MVTYIGEDHNKSSEACKVSLYSCQDTSSLQYSGSMFCISFPGMHITCVLACSLLDHATVLYHPGLLLKTMTSRGGSGNCFAISSFTCASERYFLSAVCSWCSIVLVQGSAYGMTPQQQMQTQHLFAAQQMQMAGGRQPAVYGAQQLPAQAGAPWMQQQPPSFTPTFPQIQQNQFSGVAGPSGFP